MLEISTFINNPESITEDSISTIREIIDRYPYFSSARILLLQSIHKYKASDFEDELNKTSIFLPDRSLLSAIIETGEHPNQDFIVEDTSSSSKKINTPSRTVSLIDNYLTKQNSSTELETKIKADATNDYTGYLLQLDDLELPEKTPHETRHAELVSSFIERDEPIKLNSNPAPPPSSVTDSIDEIFFTETLATIYIKQKRYDKAIEIIRKLYLSYPKKNGYFADQIRFLEKLIITNKQNKIK